MDTPLPSQVIAPILVSPALERDVATYTEVFGFTPVEYFGGNADYVVMQRHAAQLHVMRGKTSNPNHRSSGHVADVFVWVHSLDAVLERARHAGLQVTRGPEHYASAPVATTEVVIEDLSGYWFCFAVASHNSPTSGH